MEANDIESESVISQFQETGEVQHVQEVQEIYVEEGNEEDVHVCRKCNIVFYDIQKYLEHKVKHDNFKVKLCKSDVDKRMIMPKLVQRQVRPKKEKLASHAKPPDEEKENDQQTKTGKSGRRKLSEVHSQDLVITEKPVYICTKCDRKFNREASLKRHMEYDHKDDSDDDDADNEEEDYDMSVDDEYDHEYKPSLDVVKETIKEDEEAEEEMLNEAPTEGTTCTEIDSLDQVIMAAALVEKAEAQSGGVQLGQIQLCLSDDNGAVSNSEVVMIANSVNSGTTMLGSQMATRLNGVPAAGKRFKLTDDDKTGRRFVCGICKNRFKELAVLKAHMLTHTNKREFNCLFEGCTYAFKTKGSLKRHMRRHTGERPYPCELCGRTFAESGALTRHLKSRTPCASKTDDDLPRYRKTWATDPNIPAAGALAGELPENEQPNSTATTGNIVQSVSVINVQQVKNTDNEGRDELSTLHTANEVVDGIQDSQDKHLFDGTLTEGAEVVITHDMKTMTNDVDTITADESIQEFVHSETVSQSDSTVCKVCQEEFLSQEALKTHLRTHLAEDTCKCQLCHFITESKEEFENHMFLHHHVQIRSSDPLSELVSSREERNETRGSDTMEKAQVALKQLMDLPPDSGEMEPNNEITDTLYKCPVCNKQFRRCNYLKFHMRNHTGLRPHKCPKCSRSFITRDTLKKHMATHIDDRSFKCGECGKLFKRLSHVREHIKIHSTVRPFMCTICDKTFKTNNAMKVHLRTHTDILPYECSFCHRRFREKGSVIRHTRMHTGEKPFECRFCGRKFAEHGTLNRHLKAKVSCKRQVVMMKDFTDDEETDYSVLAEFSSVVADTQQYMVPENEEELEVKESEAGHEQVSDQPTEIVVVQSGDSDGQLQNVEIENVEVLTNEDGSPTTVEALQVTDDYIVITDTSSNIMSVLDSKTGETVAIVPMSHADSSENHVQTITMSQEGEVSTVTMVPDNNGEYGEMVTIAQLIEDGNGLQQAMETTDGTEVQVMEAVQTNEEGAVDDGAVDDGAIDDGGEDASITVETSQEETEHMNEIDTE